MSAAALALNPNAQPGVVLKETGGLNATPNGSTDDAVLRFDNDPTPAGEGITVATTAANGTIVTINRPGIYTVELLGSIDASAADGLIGMSVNGNAASLNSAVSYSNTGTIAALPILTAASTKTPFAIGRTVEVYKGTPALVRFLATTAAGATGGGALIASSVAYFIAWHGPRQGRTV